MKSFRAELAKPKLTLVYSLPENKIELAEAALAAGADAIKVHISVHHHASGTHFGSLEDEWGVLTDILKLAGDKCVGIVPGGGRVIKPEEIYPLKEMGFTFVSFYAHHCSPEILSIPGIEKMVAPDYTYSSFELQNWAKWGVDVIETSIIDPNGYGEPLNLRDLGRYNALTQFGLPLLVPTQRKLTPSDLPSLIKAGVQGVMLGAVVTGKEPENVYIAIKEFRQAIDRNED
ncbi:MAG: hypothetical protein GX956_10615 [Firmicutes bacterium]|nr:hypothetical protein [Bacillota bacterium]